MHDYPYSVLGETHDEAEQALTDELAYWMEAGFVVIDENAVEVCDG